MSEEVEHKQAEDCFLHLMLLCRLERLLVSALHQVATLQHTQEAFSAAVCEKVPRKYRKANIKQ